MLYLLDGGSGFSGVRKIRVRFFEGLGLGSGPVCKWCPLSGIISIFNSSILSRKSRASLIIVSILLVSGAQTTSTKHVKFSVYIQLLKGVLVYLVYVIYIVQCFSWYIISIDDIFSPFFTYFISRYPLNGPFLYFVNMQSYSHSLFLKRNSFQSAHWIFHDLFTNNNEPSLLVL